MLKKYSESIAPREESKIAPSNDTLNAILNYSKSVEVKTMKSKKSRLMIHLN